MSPLTLKAFLQQSPLSFALQGQSSIYVSPNIPYKKFLGAQSYLPQHVQVDEVLILIDDTVFGSAKIGLCITSEGLYYKADFEEPIYCSLAQLRSIQVETGFLNQSLLLNQQSKLNFTQPDRQGIQTVANVLNAFIQQSSNSQTGPLNQNKSGNRDEFLAQVPLWISSSLALHLYIASFQTGEICSDHQALISAYFSRVGEEARQYCLDHLLDQPVRSFGQITQQLRQAEPTYDYGYKCITLDLVLRLMFLNGYESDDLLRMYDEISFALKVSDDDATQIVVKVVSEIEEAAQPNRQQQSEYQHDQFFDLNAEQQKACQLLDLSKDDLNMMSIKKAYRKKIAEFHPDQYQQLPESVRLLIEQQAQQLNQARDILEKLLTN